MCHSCNPALNVVSTSFFILCFFPEILVDLKELSVFHFLSSVSCDSLCFPPSSLCSCHSVHQLTLLKCRFISSRPGGNAFTLIRGTFHPSSFPVLGCRNLKESVRLSTHLLMFAQIKACTGHSYVFSFGVECGECGLCVCVCVYLCVYLVCECVLVCGVWVYVCRHTCNYMCVAWHVAKCVCSVYVCGVIMYGCVWCVGVWCVVVWLLCVWYENVSVSGM